MLREVVRYQYLDANAWCGSASVWAHFSGDIQKIAACKVKPYELMNQGADIGNEYNEVMK